MNAWWSDRQAKDQFGFSDLHKRNGIKIALSADLKKDIKVMFWGCFGGMVKMGLTDLFGNPESKGGGVTG